MIVFDCLLCSLENLSTDVIRCPGCGGSNFVPSYSTLSQPEQNRHVIEQAVNYSDKHTQPTTEAKGEDSGSSTSINEQNESVERGFTSSYDDSTNGGSDVKNTFTEDAVPYNLNSQNVSLVQVEPSAHFSQYPLEQKRLLPEIENVSGFTYSSSEEKNDICNATRLNVFQDTLTVPSTQPPHVATFFHPSSSTEYENQFQMEMMFESPKKTESLRLHNEDGKIGFAGSSQFVQENSMLQTFADDTIGKSKIKDTRDKGNNSSPSLLVKIGNSSTRTSLSQDLELVNEVSHSKAHSSKETRMDDQYNTSPLLANRSSAGKSKCAQRCGKCHRYFVNKLKFKLHEQNNCDAKPFKCNLCDNKYDHESQLNRHRAVHSGQKPFKCDQCNFVTKWKSNLNTHDKRFHRNSI